MTTKTDYAAQAAVFVKSLLSKSLATWRRGQPEPPSVSRFPVRTNGIGSSPLPVPSAWRSRRGSAAGCLRPQSSIGPTAGKLKPDRKIDKSGSPERFRHLRGGLVTPLRKAYQAGHLAVLIRLLGARQTLTVRTWTSICSGGTVGPCPLPGQSRHVWAQSAGVETFDSQNGQVRH